MFSGGQFTERKSRGNCEPYTLGCQRWAGREGIKSQHTEGGRVSSHAGSQTALIPEAINDSHSFILGCIPKYKWDSSCVLFMSGSSKRDSWTLEGHSQRFWVNWVSVSVLKLRMQSRSGFAILEAIRTIPACSGTPSATLRDTQETVWC